MWNVKEDLTVTSDQVNASLFIHPTQCIMGEQRMIYVCLFFYLVMSTRKQVKNSEGLKIHIQNYKYKLEVVKHFKKLQQYHSVMAT